MVVGRLRAAVFRLIRLDVIADREVEGGLVLDLRGPLRAVIDVVRIRAERADEVRGRGADRVGKDLGVQSQLLGRLVDGDRLRQVARVHHDIRVGRPGLTDEAADVSRSRRAGVVWGVGWTAISITPVRYLFAGDKTPNVYL